MGRLALSVALACAACGRVHYQDVPDARGDALVAPDGPPDVAIDARDPIVARVEAETNPPVASFTVAADTAASGGMYVLDGNSMGMTGAGQVAIDITIPATAAGPFYLWGRVLAPDTSRDSFFLSVDGGTNLNYDTGRCVHSTQWQWTVVGNGALLNCPTVPPPIQYMLAPGAHTIVLKSREGQSAIDEIIVTDDPAFVPSG